MAVSTGISLAQTGTILQAKWNKSSELLLLDSMVLQSCTHVKRQMGITGVEFVQPLPGGTGVNNHLVYEITRNICPELCTAGSV